MNDEQDNKIAKNEIMRKETKREESENRARSLRPKQVAAPAAGPFGVWPLLVPSTAGPDNFHFTGLCRKYSELSTGSLQERSSHTAPQQ